MFFGLVDIKADSSINRLILIFGSSCILFDGGASIRLKFLKEVWITIVVIATIGVLITGAVAGMLVGMNAPGARVIAPVIFVALLIQATTTKWLAKKLGLLVDE